MLTYQVVSNSRRVIDGLGVFEAEVPQTFTEAEAEWFATLRGIKLNQGSVPEDVTVIIKVDGEVE